MIINTLVARSLQHSALLLPEGMSTLYKPVGILLHRESVNTTESAIELIQACLPTAEVLEIDVGRNYLLVDALREGRKKRFPPTKQLKARIKSQSLYLFDVYRSHLLAKRWLMMAGHAGSVDRKLQELCILFKCY